MTVIVRYGIVITDSIHYPDGPWESGGGWNTPMQVMNAINSDFTAGGYGTCTKVECYRYVDGVRRERQWVLEID